MTSEHKEGDAGTSVVNGVVTTGQERDLDPPKVCTGKGAVTLWASPINEDNLSTSHTTSPQDIQPSESAATGKTETDDWRLFPSVDSVSDAQPTALAAKGYRSVRPSLSESKPHDATYSATITKPQTEVIVVPFQQIYTDRGQEASSSTSPLLPLGQSSKMPDGTSTGSLLTLPTLDDFIPPHLQKDSNHNQPSSSSETVPPVHLKPPPRPPPPPPPPPPPSLIPPVPEVSNSALDAESTGMILRTVSLATCHPDMALLNLCSKIKTTFLTRVLNFEPAYL